MSSTQCLGMPFETATNSSKNTTKLPGKQAPSGEVAGGQHWWCLHCSHTPKCFVMRGRWMLFHWGSPGADGAATSMPWETTFSVVTSPNLPLMQLLLSRRVVNVSRPDCSVLACRLAFGVLIGTNATSFARGASMPKLSHKKRHIWSQRFLNSSNSNDRAHAFSISQSFHLFPWNQLHLT